mgnify:CR=1 FL=1|tara:strand:- start:301 stop:1329 length:1029 start_codon:yes stop_codon:yes gene_type:complete
MPPPIDTSGRVDDLNSTITSDFDNLNSQLNEYLDLVEELQGILDTTQAELTAAESSGVADASTINALNGQITTLNAQISELTATETAFNIFSNSVAQALQGTYSGHDSTATSINTLKEDYDTAVSTLANTEDLLADTNQELTETQGYLATAIAEGVVDDSTISALQSQVGGLQADVSRLENLSAQQSSSISNLESQLSTANAQIGTLNNTLDSFVAELEATNTALDSVETNLEQFDVLSETLGGEITSLEAYLRGYGYNPIPTEENFSGQDPLDFSNFVNRAIDVRKFYFNANGKNGKVTDIDNELPTMDFNADGGDSESSGILKFAIIGLLIWCGSKILKK